MSKPEPTPAERVQPRTLKGCRDLLPEEVIHRNRVVRTIETVFERYGFLPLETPALEHLETLLGTGGEEVNKELFRLDGPEGDPLALRFDLTVPFARVLAQYPDRLKLPVRRYAIGPVWRADKPDPGRYRQFTQCDIDIAGTESIAADGEIISVMCAVMTELGCSSHRVLINNRRIVDTLLEGSGIDESDRQKHVLRVIDKLPKVGVDNVRLELGPGRVDDSGDPIRGVQLDPAVIDRLLAFVAVEAGDRMSVVDAMEAELPQSDGSETALAGMRELADVLTALGVPEDNARFAPSLTRGLDYYTGAVFEMMLPDAPQSGSVMGGGRYDGLVSRFLDRAIPAVGMSIGLDRLMAALEALDIVHPQKSTVDVLVVTLGNVPAHESLRAARELRDAGLRVETYFGSRMRMKDQLSHADRHEMPVAVILGEDELARGEVSVKDLRTGKQEKKGIEDRDAYRKAGTSTQTTVPRNEMSARVLAMLEDLGVRRS